MSAKEGKNDFSEELAMKKENTPKVFATFSAETCQFLCRFSYRALFESLARSNISSCVHSIESIFS